MEIVKIKKGDTELEVAKRVYDVVYAHHGFTIVEPKKPTTRKKVDKNDA